MNDWRFKSGYTRGVGMLRRLINEFLLYFRGWGAIVSQVTPPFLIDVVATVQTYFTDHFLAS